MRKIAALLLVVLYLVWHASPVLAATRRNAVAQSIKPKHEIALTPTIGEFLFDGKDRLQDSPMSSLKLSYNLTASEMFKSIGIDAIAGYADTKVTSNNSKATVYHLRADVIYPFIFKESRFIPFIAVGAGSNFYQRTSGSERTAFVDYGAGVKYKILDFLFARADLRHFLLMHAQGRDNMEFTVGLAFAYGLDKKPPPVVEKKEEKKEVKEKKVKSVKKEEKPPEPEIQVEQAEPATAKPVIAIPFACPFKITAIKPLDNMIEIVSDSPFEDYKSFIEQKPERLVIDIPCALNGTGQQNIFLGQKGVVGARLGTSEDKLRIVFDSDQAKFPQFQLEKLPTILRIKLADAAVKEAPQDMSELMRFTIEYDTAKWAIYPKYTSNLKKAALLLKKYPAAIVEIMGHTDHIGKEQYNVVLSQKRAESVKNYLMKRERIAAGRFFTRGFGFYKPIADNETVDGRQRNRRSEVSIVIKNRGADTTAVAEGVAPAAVSKKTSLKAPLKVKGKVKGKAKGKTKGKAPAKAPAKTLGETPVLPPQAAPVAEAETPAPVTAPIKEATSTPVAAPPVEQR